ncbi:hypothetical protein HDE_03502 [Halotydeus destructor]|nr:hypothetical protein HDE_03502 [Halotydeus destructor]
MSIDGLLEKLRLWDAIFAVLVILFTIAFGLIVVDATLNPEEQGLEALRRLNGSWKGASSLFYVYVISASLIILSASSVFIYIQLGCHYYIKSCQENMSVSHASNNEAHEIYNKIQNIRLNVNQLGLVPFILCSQLFVKTTLAVTNRMLYLSQDNQNVRLMELETFVTMAVFVTINFIAEECTKNTNDIRQKILILFSNTRCYRLREYFSSLKSYLEISQAPVVPVLAWDFFVLEKTFILRFLGALIPFTVMAVTTIVQLQDFESQKY